MEENESSKLTNNQQEPEINNTQEAQPAAAAEAISGVGHVTAESISAEAEVEAMAKEIATQDEENANEAQAETAAPQFNVHTAEELKEMTDEQILSYLKEIAQTRPARPARDAVAAIKAEIDQRIAPKVEDVAEAPEAGVEAQPEAQATPAVEASDETATEPAAAEAPATEEEVSPVVAEIRSLLAAFEAAVEAEREEQRKEMENNAKEKRALLEEFGQIVKQIENSNPSAKLRAVRDIISKWKSIGYVSSSQRSINKEFKALSDEFFSKLNIERELRDLDHKKNLVEKTKLCEMAEALDKEPSTRKAYSQIVKLRETWKTIGPVAHEESDAVWKRFSEAANVITKKFRQLNADEKEKEKENYQKKLAICEEVEAFLNQERTSRKEIEALADKAQEFVTRWRSIGFAPKAVNDEIYARFRKSIDALYAIRKSFFKEQDARYAQNYKLKEALCEKAEAVMNSNDWRKTSDYLIELQREWKEIGPVANKHSELIWRRFRSACDTFFNNRQSQKDGETAEMKENLEKKRQVIAELEAYTAPEDAEQHLNDLKGFLQRWNSIGMVPSKEFASTARKFSDLVNKHYDKLNIDKAEAEIERYRGKVEALAAEGGDRLTRERVHIQNLLRQAEQDAETLENNISFFSKSKSSEKLVKEYTNKIAKAKADVEALNKKLAIVNEAIRR